MSVRRTALSVAVFGMLCGLARPQAGSAVLQPTPGETDALSPPQPTLRLPRNFVPTGYSARLTVDPAKTGLDGSMAITGNVSERSRVIWLHGWKLAIGKAVARRDTTDVALTVTAKGDDLLEVRAAVPLDQGQWTLSIDYHADYETVATTGAFKQTVGGDSYVYTQFESIDARRASPCVDEPDNKVPWELTLDVPRNLVAVSNTPGTESALDANLKRVDFERTPPLPSYLVAFGVGPFEIVDAGKTRTGQPIRVLTLAHRAAEGAWAARTARTILTGLEDWFGTPYPYAKLDLLAIPITVGFGAMENAGLITFTETLILNDPIKASKSREHDWVELAAHEMAHQWFGDLVTMKFWDDIWLNEGFATWMETKVTSLVDPTYHDESNELEMRNTALRDDSLVSARQIRQPIESADDILTAFDGITYQKGASVLHMFEHYVGPATFQQGVREYLKARAFGSATSRDFVEAIAAADGGKHGDIAGAFNTFLDRAGAPEIAATVSCSGSGASLEATAVLRQHRYLPPGAPAPSSSSGPWVVPVCAAYDQGGKRGEACTLLSTETATLDLPATSCPRWLMPNTGGHWYYRVALTAAQAADLRDHAWSQLSPTERRATYFDIRNAAVTGHLPLQLALSFVPKLLAASDRFTIRHSISLPDGIEEWVPDALRPQYEFWMRRTFGPSASAAGFMPKGTDTLDIESSRDALLFSVAWLGRDPALVADAVKLADRYRELPQSIRGLVLRIATDATPALFEQLRRDVHTEPDRTRREEVLVAMALVRNPAQHMQALELLLDPMLDIRETSFVSFTGSTEANRAMGRSYFKTHADAILARLPKEGNATDQTAGFAYVFTNACKADEREAAIAYVTKTFQPLPGGVRIVKQAIESMDQCIAKRATLEPEIRRWLAAMPPPPTSSKQ